MFDTLRRRLIISYVGVVLPALLLATGAYLVLGITYRRDDAYRQLTSGMYMVAPQIENVLVRERIAAAVQQVQSDLLLLTEGALQRNLSPTGRTQVLAASDRIRTDLLQIDDALTPGTAKSRQQVLTATATIRAQLRIMQAALAPSPPVTATADIQANLLQIENPLGSGPTQATSQRILRATESIRGELQNTGFRLLIIRPDGADGVVLLDSQAGTDNHNGALFKKLPAPLIQDTPPSAPVPGNWPEGSTRWIYEAAPPSILVTRTPGAQLAPLSSRYFVLLAAREPNIGDVVNDFLSRFLLFGVIALVVVLALGALLARSITRPLGALAAATHQIAQGNYAHQAPVTGSAEIRALATDFNAMSTQVQQTQQAQRDFLANVSHDLKTPLTSIQGYSQAMIEGALRDRAAFIEAAGVINAESLRMARLVGDLVDLVRLQSGEAPIRKQPIDVPSLLQQTMAGMQPQATARHVELRVESSALPAITADPDRLRRAITNLVDNALRYTPPEGRVTLRAAQVPGAVRISVTDTGAGIPPGDLPRIFERFYQVDKSRASHGHGSGLGLAIVREIATAHGGDVAVQSRPGAGSEFTITLPV